MRSCTTKNLNLAALLSIIKFKFEKYRKTEFSYKKPLINLARYFHENSHFFLTNARAFQERESNLWEQAAGQAKWWILRPNVYFNILSTITTL